MRLIDADNLDYTCNADECGMLTGCNHCQYHIITKDEIDSAPTVEAISKADYENRLKADMVAMLTELQLEIEEIKPLEPTDDEDWQYGCFHGLELMQDKCLKLIQQKINSLKEA